MLTDSGFPGVRIGVLLQKSMTPKRQYLGIHHGANHREADAVTATLAAGETAVRQQRSLVHQTVGPVFHPVNAAQWNRITGNKLHTAKLLEINNQPAKPVLIKTNEEL